VKREYEYPQSYHSVGHRL